MNELDFINKIIEIDLILDAGKLTNEKRQELKTKKYNYAMKYLFLIKYDEEKMNDFINKFFKTDMKNFTALVSKWAKSKYANVFLGHMAAINSETNRKIFKLFSSVENCPAGESLLALESYMLETKNGETKFSLTKYNELVRYLKNHYFNVYSNLVKHVEEKKVEYLSIMFELDSIKNNYVVEVVREEVKDNTRKYGYVKKEHYNSSYLNDEQKMNHKYYEGMMTLNKFFKEGILNNDGSVRKMDIIDVFILKPTELDYSSFCHYLRRLNVNDNLLEFKKFVQYYTDIVNNNNVGTATEVRFKLDNGLLVSFNPVEETSLYAFCKTFKIPYKTLFLEYIINKVSRNEIMILGFNIDSVIEKEQLQVK